MRRKKIENFIKIVMIAEFCMVIFFWLKHDKVILTADAEYDSNYKIEIKNRPLTEKEKIVTNSSLGFNKDINPAICSSDNLENEKKLAQAEAEKERQAEILRKQELVRIIEASKPKVIAISCREKNYGNPSESDTKGKHMDEDCCPDPDEWPKPGCIYDAKSYAIMLKKP